MAFNETNLGPFRIIEDTKNNNVVMAPGYENAIVYDSREDLWIQHGLKELNLDRLEMARSLSLSLTPGEQEAVSEFLRQQPKKRKADKLKEFRKPIEDAFEVIAEMRDDNNVYVVLTFKETSHSSYDCYRYFYHSDKEEWENYIHYQNVNADEAMAWMAAVK